MKKADQIFVAGHRGMVGSAIVRLLRQEGYTNLLLRTSKELDLRKQSDVEVFFTEQKPDYVFLAAAKVGGILANNTLRATFLYDNLVLQTNVIHAAYESGVKKLLFLGSSCIYPKLADQPISEDSLLTGVLEPTNEPYAIAKIAGIKMCDAYRDQYGCDFISAMPTNLYGPNDNYDLQSSHVLPALLRKFIQAKRDGLQSVTLWGTGKPRREFLHVDDMASAALYLMEHFSGKGPINVGTGSDISILKLAHLIKEISGFAGEITHDRSKPDGMLRKLLDVSKLKSLGWEAKIELSQGLLATYDEVKNSHF